MSTRRLISWLFALALLLGQAAAFAHELSHLRTHDTALPDKVCAVCIAQAQLGAAMPPSLVTLAPPPDTCIFLSTAAPLRVDLSPHTACARAPPAPSRT
jgi:hypothetical protein